MKWDFVISKVLEICTFAFLTKIYLLSINCIVDFRYTMIYSGTSLKRKLTGQNFLFALERCPPWRGLN